MQAKKTKKISFIGLKLCRNECQIIMCEMYMVEAITLKCLEISLK